MSREDGEPDDWAAAAQPSAASIVADVETGESSRLQHFQSVSAIISLFLSPIAIILVSVWVSNESMGGGGVSWSEGDAKRVFNWHPVLMIVAYSIMNVAALIFRVSGTSSYQTSNRGISDRGIIKAIHGYVWVACFLIGSVGMLAVIKSHNDAVSGYIANLYSLHSWVGVLVMTLYTLQLLVGIFAFGGLSGSSRLAVPSLMEIHKYTGTVLHMLITATILLGIQEKEGFIQCWYEVTDGPDLIPILNYGKIPSACKISHGLGIVVLLMGVFTSFALARFPVLL